MKTIRLEKKLSCAHVDSGSNFTVMHIATATEKGHTVTMTKEENNYLTGALQKQHNGKMIPNHQISKEKAGFVTYSFLKSRIDKHSKKV